MNREEEVLIEQELAKAILTFHDCDDKEKRERYVREYFLEYCEENNINQSEALEIIERVLKFKRENTVFKYEHFTDLKSIIYPESKKKNSSRSLDDEEDGR